MEAENSTYLQAEHARTRRLTLSFIIHQINEEKTNLTQQEERFENRIKKEKDLVQSALADVERCNAEAQQMRARKVKFLLRASVSRLLGEFETGRK